MSVNTSLDNVDVYEAFNKHDNYSLKLLNENFFNCAQTVKRTLDCGVTPDEFKQFNALYEALMAASDVCVQACA